MAEPVSGNNKPLVLWLLTCCALVFAMVIVGAVTRLTESGLSIAEWKPLMGALPPLSGAEWERVFDLYKQTPQFQKVNGWMDLAAFKHIFFWEWVHRFLGRIIGIVYLVPFLYFLLRKKIPHDYKLKLVVPFILGGAQGFLGWYMVKSGLVDVPAVSHYRLAAHLGLAFLILCVMYWLALSLKNAARSPHKILFEHGVIVLLFVLTTICWGAFTAGLDGGLIYNDTFPNMGPTLIPPEAQQSVIDNPAGVQFLHRWLAMSTVLMIWIFWAHAVMKRAAFPALHALAIMSLLQVGLGIATLFSGVSVPIAVTHQAGALTVLLLLVTVLHRLDPRKK
jgi:cytochrome c oxidase assembly protein subunit 15